MQFFPPSLLAKQTRSTVVELSAKGEIPFQVCHQARLYFGTANQRKSSFAVYSNSQALNMF